MNPRTQSIFAVVLMALTAALSIYNYPSDSTKSIALLITIAVFACVWGITRSMARAKGCNWATSTARREIVGSIVLASLILLGAITLSVLQTAEVIDGDVSKRMIGVILGAVLVFMGNTMPKKLAPIDAQGSCAANGDPARNQKLQRFMGWTFVIAGLLYMGVWMLVDLDKTGFAVLLTFPVAVGLIMMTRLVILRTVRIKASA